MIKHFLFVFFWLWMVAMLGWAQPRDLYLLTSERVGETPVWLYTNRPQDPSQSVPLGVDLCNSSYFFAVGSEDAVALIIRFTRERSGQSRAEFYQANAPERALSYRLVGGDLDPRIGAPTLVLKTRAPSDAPECWLDNEQSIYDLELAIDGAFGFSTDGVFPDDLPDGQTDVRVSVFGRSGVPWSQAAEVTDESYSGGRRLRVTQRMEDGPPFRVMAPFFSGFAYFNIGEPLLGSRWFSENLSPIYFNLETLRLEVVDFVGFKMGGVYWINSSTAPPEVNFESPMAFYSFDPSTRYTQLIIRADHGFETSPLEPKPEMGFRYSWKTDDERRWRYSLQLLGSRTYDETVTLAGTDMHLETASSLPGWIMNQAWPVATFVESIGGYGGSEGIYFYTVQGRLAYSWLVGRAEKPPGYFSDPYLPDNNRLSTLSVRGLPPGFKGEYAAAYQAAPSLYFSDIDGRVHLKGASEGFWHLDDYRLLHSRDLDGDGYLDSWERQRFDGFSLSADALPARSTPEERLSLLPGRYLLYEGSEGLVMSAVEAAPPRHVITPPTDKESWLGFRTALGEYEARVPPKDPFDLSTWRWEGDPVLEGGRLGELWVDSGIFELSVSAPDGLQFLGERREAGRYVLAYRDGALALEPLLPLTLTADIARDGDTLVLSNESNLRFEGPVVLEAKGQAMYSWSAVSLSPHGTKHLDLSFIPISLLKQADSLSFGERAPTLSLLLEQEGLADRPGVRTLLVASGATSLWSYALLAFAVLTLLGPVFWIWRQIG